jgi:hypothetical protein
VVQQFSFGFDGSVWMSLLAKCLLFKDVQMLPTITFRILALLILLRYFVDRVMLLDLPGLLVRVTE